MPPLLRLSGRQLLWIGFFLVLAGAVLPMLMVLGYIQINFFLAFLTYGMSLVGLMFGIIGAAIKGVQRRLKEDQENSEIPEEYR